MLTRFKTETFRQISCIIKLIRNLVPINPLCNFGPDWLRNQVSITLTRFKTVIFSNSRANNFSVTWMILLIIKLIHIKQNELDWLKTYPYSISNALNGDSSINHLHTMNSINFDIDSWISGVTSWLPTDVTNKHRCLNLLHWLVYKDKKLCQARNLFTFRW